MIFLVAKLFWLVAAPSNAILACLVLGLLLRLVRRLRRLGEALLVLGVGALLLVAVLPLHVWVAQPLENRFPQPAPPARVDGIVVLGGGQLPEVSNDRNQPAFRRSMGRITAGVALLRAHPDARLVLSGGNGELVATPDTRESDTNKRVLAELGVDPADPRILHEDKSRDTWENAVFTQRLVDPKPGETWLVVTSAQHMPRAVGIFRRIGWTVVPWPVDFVTQHDGAGPYPGELGSRLQALDGAVREWIGLAGYRLTGRIDTLFPAP